MMAPPSGLDEMMHSYGLWFLSQFFPASLAEYRHENGLRADLRNHPMQQRDTYSSVSAIPCVRRSQNLTNECRGND